MPLPTSGPISFADLQTEFGGNNPIAFDEYFRGGLLVPGGTAAGTGSFQTVPLSPLSPVQISSSGTIQLSMFYGTTKQTVTIFNASGTYAVPSGVTSVQVLLIAGGGGGGGPLENTREGGGAGGGGGVILYRNVSVTPGANIPVTVGAGGAGAYRGTGTDGGDSAFGTVGVNDPYVALGGGGGGGGGGAREGRNGGSGGGGCGLGGARNGGRITAPGINTVVAPGFGSEGGRGGWFAPGGGGGGALGRGVGAADYETTNPTNGGNGVFFSIADAVYSGGAGGGGGADEFEPSAGAGGSGGGGSGGGFGGSGPSGVAGAVNTGGGGGGGRPTTGTPGTGGNGGSGRVIVSSVESFPANTVYPSVQSAVSATDFSPLGSGFADATISINSNGEITRTGNPGIGLEFFGENAWFSTIAPGVGNPYWIRFDVTRGNGQNTGPSHTTSPGTWYPLSSSYSFSASVVSSGNGIQSQGGSVLFVISTTPSDAGRVSSGILAVTAAAEGVDPNDPNNLN